MPTPEGNLPPQLQEAIDTIAKNENFKTYSIEIKDIEPDSSFLGILRAVTIKGKTEDHDKVLHLFAKTMPEDGDVAIYSISYTYENEIYMYSDFQATISELQEEAKIPTKERFTLAKSYKGTDSGSIIMENLIEAGYKVFPRKEVVTLEFAKLAIEQLAKYHSFAFIIKDRRPQFFEDKVRKMKQPFSYGRPSFNSFAKNFSRISINFLNPEQKKKIEAFLPTTFEKYHKYTQDPECTWTMVHGDFRQSNVMVKFDNGDPSNVMVIDYQHAFYGCSVIDFIYFIIAGTDQEFRKNHLEYLKNFYHDSMKKFLALFGMDIEKYYTKEEFEKLYKERLDYGLMVSLWLLPVILADKGEVPDVLKINLAECDFEVSDLIKKRVRGIVDDYIQWGYV